MKFPSKVTVAEFANAVPEQYRGLYTEVAGSMVLTGIDVESHPDITGLKNTVTALRTEVSGYKDNLAKFSGVDLTKYAELTELERQAKEGELIKAGKLDELVELRVGPMRKKLMDDLKAANDTIAKQVEDINIFVIDRATQEACLRHNVEENAFPDVLQRVRQTSKVDKMKPVVMDGENMRYSPKNGAEPMSIDELVESFATTAPHLFKKSEGGGAKGGNGGKTPIGAINVSDQASFLKNLDKIASGEVTTVRR